MKVSISPIHFRSEFPPDLRTDHKIEIFFCRTISQINDVKDSTSIHVVLRSALPLLETFEQYKRGYSPPSKKTKKLFKDGAQTVFSNRFAEYDREYNTPAELRRCNKERFLCAFYDLRCNIVHNNLVGESIAIDWAMLYPFGYYITHEPLEGTFVMKINPRFILIGLEEYLRAYVTKLRNGKGTNEFENHFDCLPQKYI